MILNTRPVESCHLTLRKESDVKSQFQKTSGSVSLAPPPFHTTLPKLIPTHTPPLLEKHERESGESVGWTIGDDGTIGPVQSSGGGPLVVSATSSASAHSWSIAPGAGGVVNGNLSNGSNGSNPMYKNVFDRLTTPQWKGSAPRQEAKYTFLPEHIFDSSQTTVDLYRVAGSGIVSSVVSGCNGALIAYGQTGAGKVERRECAECVNTHACVCMEGRAGRRG